MIGVMPIGTLPGDTRQKAAVFWSMPRDAHSRWVQNRVDAWKGQATALWPEFAPFLRDITAPDQMTMARYAHGTLRRPYGDGSVFIGDAAHRASPQLGQGANMALLDAKALAMALRCAPMDQALPLYAKARRWHVWVYQMTSAAFTPQYQSNSRILPILRDYALFPLSRIPPAPQFLTGLVRGDILPSIRLKRDVRARQHQPDDGHDGGKGRKPTGKPDAPQPVVCRR